MGLLSFIYIGALFIKLKNLKFDWIQMYFLVKCNAIKRKRSKTKTKYFIINTGFYAKSFSKKC
jgi:hypothetical protein